MLSLRNVACGLVSVLIAVSIASRLFAEAPPSAPNRLPRQSHNRMVCIKAKGKDVIYVNMPGHFDLGSPSISPDGKWIAFDAMTVGEKPIRESWLLGVEGKGLKKLADGAVPRWSPDGKRILFTRCQFFNEKGVDVEKGTIFELDMASGKKRELVKGRFADWSPDGTRLAFANEGEPTSTGGTFYGSKLYIAGADGRKPKELTDGDWPTWSPDGKKIAYCMHKEGAPPQIHLIDMKTKKTELVGIGGYRPQWSGDGKSVYCNGLLPCPDLRGHRRAPVRLWVDKSRVEFFALDKDCSFAPCMSRDGRTLVLIVDSDGRAKTWEEEQAEAEKEERIESHPEVP